MSTGYDICVDYETLCELQNKLKIIAYDLTSSTDQMNRAVQNSGEFLAGHQFEKALKITMACIRLTERTNQNISRAAEYLENLKEVLEEYGRCTYAGGDI